MSTGCSCLKMCSILVALGNLGLGLYILIWGSLLLKEYVENGDVTIGFVIVNYQISFFLIFVGFLLLIGTIQSREKHISLYLLLSSLVWFVITTLAIMYMLFYNTTSMINDEPEDITTTTIAPELKETVPLEKAVGFSSGLLLFWCGQLGVYKFHDQVVQKNVINAGERYVSFAHHKDEA